MKRPIERKKVSEKDVGEYLAKKMKFIEESQEQEKEKESAHIKAEKGSLGRVEV